MALTVDYSVAPFLITIPKSDLTLITGTQYRLLVDDFWLLMRDFTDNENTMAQPPLYRRIPATAGTPSITEVDETYYALELEDGLYSVNIEGGNTNIREVEVKNQVSVNTNNTSGFYDHTSEAIEHLEKMVWIDTEAVFNGDGTQEFPFNTLTDAIDYAETKNIKTLYVYSDIVVDRQLKNYKIRGVGTPTVDTNGQDLTKSEFWHCRMEGTYTGVITVQESVLLPNCYLNGVFEKCGLAGDLFCIDNSQVLLTQCISMIPGLGRPTISMNSTGTTQLSVRKNGGGMTIKDCNQVTDTVTVESSEGSVTFDDSCTNGNMVVRGDCKFVDDTNGATVTNETIPKLVWSVTEGLSVENKLAEVWQLLALDPTHPLVVSATQQIVDLITINVTGTDTKTATRV